MKRSFVGLNNRRGVFCICLLLVATIWFVFGQTLRHEFINFDDGVYVSENSIVQAGLTTKGVVWAFTHSHASNWHPMTTLSHMLDCEIKGLNAGWHHLINVLLHSATAILLFLVLRKMTARFWSAAFIAALFAIHPLRVESVAWVAERKDVLSGLFFMLTIWAYVHYARNPWSLIRYLSVLVLFAFGLMSKPMLVTLPFVLFLLDYWPLNRIKQSEVDRFFIPRQLIIEKIPLLLLSAGICLITLLVQAKALPATPIPLSFRISNALVSCIAYLGQLFYPTNLAIFYPYPITGYSAWSIGFSLLFLITILIGVYRWRQKRPYLLVGWLWFLVMLIPVIGIVQVGGQARADRYTYLPQIGLCLALTWAIVEWSASGRNRRMLLGIGATATLSVLVVAAHRQTRYWQDSGTLWNHTLACTVKNAIAENNLAKFYLKKKRYDEAITHSRNAIEIDQHYEEAQNCLALALFSVGKSDEAIAHYRAALKIKPDYLDALNNLGQVLLQVGQLDEAIVCFQKALKIQPHDTADEADLNSNLGAALFLKGQAEAAVTHLQRAVELKPDSIGAGSNLAWVLATSPSAAIRDGAKAIKFAKHANQLANRKDPKVLNVLAAAYAEAGRFPEAIETAKEALQVATVQADIGLVNMLQDRVLLYQARQPFHEGLRAPHQ